ncbi:MAG TPA: arylesterase [Pseudomonas sp.]|nr:arylesterase [Pseudomonas sp.]
MRTWWLRACLGLLLLAQSAAAETLLVVGDSISAAFGLETRQGWVSLLGERLQHEAPQWRVVNASVSGDTSAGGLARLPALLAAHAPQLVVIELGGNDGLRGLPPAQLQQNLAAMIGQSRAAGARVVLLGMKLPPNYGPRYGQAFERVYAELGQQERVALVPFFLDRVGGVGGLVQLDGIHPTAEAQPILLENLWPVLRPLL